MLPWKKNRKKASKEFYLIRKKYKRRFEEALAQERRGPPPPEDKGGHHPRHPVRGPRKPLPKGFAFAKKYRRFVNGPCGLRCIAHNLTWAQKHSAPAKKTVDATFKAITTEGRKRTAGFINQEAATILKHKNKKEARHAIGQAMFAAFEARNGVGRCISDWRCFEHRVLRKKKA